MREGLVHHIIIIPTAVSLPLLRGAAVGRWLTIFQNEWKCTRISNFFQSPISSIARNVRQLDVRSGFRVSGVSGAFGHLEIPGNRTDEPGVQVRGPDIIYLDVLTSRMSGPCRGVRGGS